MKKSASRKAWVSVALATGIVAGIVVGLPPGVASADPVGSVFTYTGSAGLYTGSVVLGVDDTLYASGFTPSNFGSPIVVGIPTLEDSATAAVANFPLSGVPTGANGIAQGPTSGTYANTILVSSDDWTGGSCGAGTASRIQAYRSDTWALVQTWSLPIGKCPNSMVVGPDGRVWFDQVYKNEVGRLNLDDSSTEFLEFPGAGSPNTQGRLGVSGGNIFFPAMGTASVSSPSSLLIVGTGIAGTTLDDTQLVPLPGANGSIVYDLHVALNGDVWVPMRNPNNLVVYRPGVGDDTFVARSDVLNTGAAKSIAQTSDGTIWVATNDFNDSKYYAFSTSFTPSTNSSTVNLTPLRSFTVTGAPTFGGYITAGPAGQDTLYRTTGTSTVQRIGVAPLAPLLTRVDPPIGPLIGGSKTVLTGSLLNTVTSVTVGGNAATIDDSTATTMTITVPPGTAGAKNVVVASATGDDTLANGFTYTNQIILNSDGGTSIDGTDGLRLSVNYNGVASAPMTSSGSLGGEQILWSNTTMNYQVGRLGALVVPSVWIGDDSTTGQLFGNGVGYTATGGSCPRCALWDDSQVLTYDGVGRDQSASLRYTAYFSSSPGDGQDDTYTMTRTIAYSDDTPNALSETWSFAFTMSSPTDDTETVKFYAGGDTAPGSSDQGFGEAKNSLSTGGVRSIASLNPTPSIGTQVGYRTLPSGSPGFLDFSGASAVALNNPGLFPVIKLGGDIGFNVQQSTHDAAIAVQWDIPDSGGVYGFETFVSRYRSLTSSAFSPPSIAADDSSLMTLTLSNPQFAAGSGLAFDLELPSQLVLADNGASTTCGSGTIVGTADDTVLTLSGATLAARSVASPNTIPSCTVTARVRAQTSGSFTLDASRVTDTSSDLTNIVEPRTLTVTASAPPAPSLTSVASGNAQLTLTWSLGGNGGSPITAVQYSTDGGATWAAVSNPASTSETISTASGGGALVNGTTYDVQVRAVNGLGNGGASNTLQGTPTGSTPTPAPSTYPPSQPREVAAVAGDGTASVSWKTPESAGSYPITDYEVQATPGAQSCLVKAPALSCVVLGLSNGTAYTFEVRALNGAGWGAWSVASQAVTPVGPKPTPTIVITGSRGSGSDVGRVFADGVTTNLFDQQVQARVHLSGQTAYENGSLRTVTSNGTFRWQRKTNKTVYVYFRALDQRDVRSNRIVIRPN